MKAIIKSSLRWNNISRKFYKSLYKKFGNKEDMERYYSHLHQAVTRRGKA